jgi:hypothetical protein
MIPRKGVQQVFDHRREGASRSIGSLVDFRLAEARGLGGHDHATGRASGACVVLLRVSGTLEVSVACNCCIALIS